MFAMAVGMAWVGAPGGRAQTVQEQAIERLRQEIRDQPEQLDLVLELGNAAVAAGNLDLALESFRGVLEHLEPDSRGAGDLHLRIGETQRRKGDQAAAIVSLKRASELLPDQPVVMGTLALVLDGAGKTAEAERAYRATLQLDPENAIAMNNLAYLLSENGGSLDEALQLAKQAEALSPEMGEAADTLGWIYLKKNLAEAAIREFEKVMGMEPERATYHLHLGMALSQKGDRPAAIAQLNEALRCNATAGEAEKIRQLLAVEK